MLLGLDEFEGVRLDCDCVSLFTNRKAIGQFLVIVLIVRILLLLLVVFFGLFVFVFLFFIVFVVFFFMFFRFFVFRLMLGLLLALGGGRLGRLGGFSLCCPLGFLFVVELFPLSSQDLTTSGVIPEP